MRELITDRIKVIEGYKKSKNLVPSSALKNELKSSILKLFEKEYAAMVDDGSLEILGHTINGDELLKLES